MTDETQEVQTEQPKATIENLDSIFKDNDDEGTEAEQVTDKEESEADTTQAAEDAGDQADDDAADDAADEAETGTPPDENKSVPIKAYLTEKRKRQELERKLAEKEGATETDESDDDAEEAESEGETETVDQVELKAKINVSRSMLLEDKPDLYPKAEEIFVSMARKDPSLIAKMNASPNPAKFAFDTAKITPEFQRWERFLDWDKAQEKEAGKANDPKAKAKTPIAKVPPDLTKAASQGSNSAPVEKASSLKDIMSDAPF